MKIRILKELSGSEKIQYSEFILVVSSDLDKLSYA